MIACLSASTQIDSRFYEPSFSSSGPRGLKLWGFGAKSKTSVRGEEKSSVLRR